MKIHTGLMSAAALLIAATAIAAPQSGGSGGAGGTSTSSSAGTSGTSGTSGATGGTSGHSGMHGSTSGSGSMQGGSMQGGSMQGGSTSGSGSMGGSSGSQGSMGGSSQGSMTGGSQGSMTGSSQRPGATAGSSMASGSGQLTGEERKFIMEANSAGMLEIQAGRLAERKAQDSEAKAYAQRMVQEHEQNAQKLMSVARAHGVTPEQKLMPKHQAMLDKLQRADGAKFDEAYGKLMDQSHADTVRLYERAQKQAKNPQLVAYIQESLPVLHDHHADAKDLPGGKGTRQATSGGGERNRGPAASDQKGMNDSSNGRGDRGTGSP